MFCVRGLGWRPEAARRRQQGKRGRGKGLKALNILIEQPCIFLLSDNSFYC